MKVLMLTDYFPPHTGGGVEQVTRELIDKLVQRGHTVTVLTIKTRPSLRREDFPRLTIHRASGLDMTKWFGVQIAVSPPLLWKLIRIIRSYRPDVIHAHNLFFRTTETVAVLKMIFNIPLITTLHLGKAEGASKFLSMLVRIYEMTIGRFIVHQSDHIITVSQAVAEHAQRINHRIDHLTVIPNGVDTDTFFAGQGNNPESQVILFVARMVSNKGPETMIRAATLVLRKHPHVKFMMVGDGPLRGRLQKYSEKSGMEQSIQFTGLRYDVPELMRQADIFVRPSTSEGMPLTVLEAMASNLPVIATPVGGTPELIKDGINGYLIPVDDHIALANSIIKLLDNPLSGVNMGQKGREMVEIDYTWESIAKKTEQVYIEEVRRKNDK